MRNHVLLIAGVVVLHVLATLALQGIYGDSYSGGFLADVDRWEPDGAGSWVARGNPTEPPPEGPSEVVPLWAHYLPIFLPGALLVLFLFTPLSRKLDRKTQSPTDEPRTDPEPED